MHLGNRENDGVIYFSTGCSSAWLERLVRDQEVAGSNPVSPTECLSHPILRSRDASAMIPRRCLILSSATFMLIRSATAS